MNVKKKMLHNNDIYYKRVAIINETAASKSGNILDGNINKK